MDFEWHGQSHGPTDPNSPFPKLQPGQKGMLKYIATARSITEICPGGFNPPPTTSSFLASSSKPAPQFRNPSFTTPRKGNFDPDLFSEASGIDSSPGDIADGEDTPDLPKATKAMAIFSNAHPAKQPVFGRYGAGFVGNSPGRADLRRGKYATAVIANKARKRKRVERDYSLAKGNQESESDSEDDSDRSKGKSKQPGPHWLGSILSGIESRPNLPNVISYWLQLTLNFFLLLLALYAMVSFWLTIRSDVDKASEVARSSVVAEITQCQRDYLSNRCASNPLPALVKICQDWGDCMERDPEMVQRARISAHTFAEILNDFIEPISWKAMVSILLPFILKHLVTIVSRPDLHGSHPHNVHSGKQPRLRNVSFENSASYSRQSFLPPSSTKLPMGRSSADTSSQHRIRYIWESGLSTDHAEPYSRPEESE